MINFRPVILSGGSGKRLWPASRESYPKQFTTILADSETMLQATARRLRGAGGERPLVLSGNEYRFIVGEQFEEIHITDRKVVIEPEGRNTGPAICAAAITLETTDPEALLVVAPSDHYIADETAFNEALQKALKIAKNGQIVTLGVVPTRPETGYGYIETKKKSEEDNDAIPFVKFTEKPAIQEAEKMLQAGNYLWNSGMFVASVSALISAFKDHAPDVYRTVKLACEQGQDDLDFFRLSQEFESAPNISFDHAIMEKTNGQVVPLDCGWNDLGSWATVHLESEKDVLGNSIKGNVTSMNCENSLLRSESSKTHVLGIGLKNTAIVAMSDAVLAVNLDDTQAVSEAVPIMRAHKVQQADSFPRSSRPWGWFETLTKRQRFRVKSIVVAPGRKLSLQSHVHRAEHWVVVEGTAKVTVDDKISMVTENESIYIPLGAVHRLENPGHVDLHLIEVQTGAYLGEDDIVRYEDDYQRESSEPNI